MTQASLPQVAANPLNAQGRLASARSDAAQAAEGGDADVFQSLLAKLTGATAQSNGQDAGEARTGSGGERRAGAMPAAIVLGSDAGDDASSDGDALEGNAQAADDAAARVAIEALGAGAQAAAVLEAGVVGLATAQQMATVGGQLVAGPAHEGMTASALNAGAQAQTSDTPALANSPGANGDDPFAFAALSTPRAAEPAGEGRASLEQGAAQGALHDVEIEVRVTGRETHFAAVRAGAATGLGNSAAVNAGGKVAPREPGRIAADEPAQAATDGEASQPAAPDDDIFALVRRLANEPEARARASGGAAPGGGTGAEQSSQSFDLAAEADLAVAAKPKADRSEQTAVPPTPAPTAAPPPMLQVAQRIAAELRATGLSATIDAGAASAAQSSTQPTADGLLKVLTIKLEPHSLGEVTVRMELKDNVISLHLAAAQRETVAALEKDREQLSKALRASGYEVDAVTAKAMELPRAGIVGTAGGADAQSLASGSQSQGQGQAQNGEAGGDRRHPGASGEGSRQRGSETFAERGGTTAAGGGLYV